jgi:hypothetical protein
VQASTSARTLLCSGLNCRLRAFAVTSVSCPTNPISALLTWQSKLALLYYTPGVPVSRTLTKRGRRRAGFTLEQVVALTTDARIPEDAPDDVRASLPVRPEAGRSGEREVA